MNRTFCWQKTPKNMLVLPNNFWMEFLLLDHCVQDCTDGTDESNCTAITCPENKFVCPKGGSNATPKCIDKAKLCDGTHDCDDGADEKDACCKKKTNILL